MHILLVNDDGWKAKGLMVLLPLLKQLGEVTVLVPDGARSGMSNAITATHPITLQKVEDNVYTTSGTPSDCVKLAINALFGGDESKIDLLVSGINHGSNASVNLIYSGTMGACFVAAEHQIPAIGLSIDDMSPDADFQYMEPYVLEVIKHLMDRNTESLNRDTPFKLTSPCYNVNAPKGPIKGIRWTRQAKSYWADEMQPQVLEDGETVYKLGGHQVNLEPEAKDTDLYALEHGYLSIQPCTIDMTNYAAI